MVTPRGPALAAALEPAAARAAVEATSSTLLAAAARHFHFRNARFPRSRHGFMQHADVSSV